ncbi:MFS transporter [Streptomyces albus subsp. chlorinus]|uniref:MFS transporter n=1 Tax=Streptomyces albus TaxID=1888 RepID=UPI00191EB431|nr:MFS transporter [Streptomyces albus]
MVSEETAAGSADTPAPIPPRRALGMLVVMIGVLISAVDGTIVVLALPEIEKDLGISLSAVTWVVIGYLLVVTVLSTQLGRFGDMFGRVRMYKAGFLVFTVGSVLCALAWDAPSIIGFRLLQGVGAALIAANSGAIISELYPPEERGRAYGFNAFGFSFGSVLGILLGGVVVTCVSWQWIFWINVPIGAVALALAARVLRDRGERRRRKLDVAGMVALGLGLFGVLWAMTGLASRPLDATMTGFLAGGLALLVAFVTIELRQEEPTLDLSLFRIPAMTPSLLASLLQGVGSFAVLFLVIMYLQGTRGMDPIDASLLLVPGYVVGATGGALGGAAHRPAGARRPRDPGARHLCRRDAGLLPDDRDEQPVAPRDREPGTHDRRQLLLPGQQRRRDEGRAARPAGHRLRCAAHVRRHRDGLLLHHGHARGRALDPARAGVRPLRRHQPTGRPARGRLRRRPGRGLPRDDGDHGPRGAPVRPPRQETPTPVAPDAVRPSAALVEHSSLDTVPPRTFAPLSRRPRH